MKAADTSPKLPPEDKLFIQQVTGTFLYYARAVDSTMRVALSAIASDQVNPTEETMKKTLKFLDYVASHPDAVLTCSVSSMTYVVAEDWDGEKYCGINMDWDYIRRKVHLFMPDYCMAALTRFRHEASIHMDQPHQHVFPAYGAKIQYVKAADTSPKLPPEDKLFIQQVTCTM